MFQLLSSSSEKTGTILLIYFAIICFLFLWFDVLQNDSQYNTQSNTISTGNTPSAVVVKIDKDSNAMIEWGNDSRILDKLCKRSMSDLQDIVWSHRGKSVYNDSAAVTASDIKRLMAKEIHNFDVDVMYIHRLNAFLVLHPSQEPFLDTFQQQNYMTIVQFFRLIKNKLSLEEDVRSCVTLEPKFDDRQLLHRLVQIVSKELIDANGIKVGIIASTFETYHIVANEIKLNIVSADASITSRQRNILIALAFRSVADVGQFHWPISANSPVADSPVDIIYMPDAKLLVNKKASRDSSIRIVAWLVDNTHDLHEALYHGADSVVSNRPVELSRFIKKVHEFYCL